MNPSYVYIAIAIVVILLVAVLTFLVNKNTHRSNRISTLASLAFGFVLAGLMFGEDPLIGYGLMGIGVILAVIDIFNRSRKDGQG